MVIRSARFSTGRGSARSLNGERKYEKEPYLGIKTGIRGVEDGSLTSTQHASIHR